MSRKIDALLAECLAAMEAGASPESCLARHPEAAEALRPLLETWLALQTVPQAPPPHPAAVAHGKARMLDAVERRAVRKRRVFPGTLLGTLRMPQWATAVAMIVVLLLGIAGTTRASASALPGDPLYPVKTATEQVRLLLTFSPEARAALEAELQAERLEEVAAVLAEGRTVGVHFRGTLTSHDAETWTVAGYTIRLTTTTTVEGAPIDGATVEVWARTQSDGSLVAERLTVLPTPSRLGGTGLSPVETPPRPTRAPRRHAEQATRTPTPSPTMTPTPTPAPTSTATPTPTASSSGGHESGGSDGHHGGETAPPPTCEQGHTPTPPPGWTPTPHPTHEPTRTPTMMPTPTHDHSGGGHGHRP